MGTKRSHGPLRTTLRQALVLLLAVVLVPVAVTGQVPTNPLEEPPVVAFDADACSSTHFFGPGPGADHNGAFADSDDDKNICIDLTSRAHDENGEAKWVGCFEALTPGPVPGELKSLRWIVDGTPWSEDEEFKLVHPATTLKVLEIELEVEDWCGQTRSLTRTYQVVPFAQPVAVADVIVREELVSGEGGHFLVDGSASWHINESDPAPLTHQWRVSWPGNNHVCGTTAVMVCERPGGFPAGETYTVSLTVRTPSGQSHTTSVPGLVIEPNRSPVAVIDEVRLFEEDWNGDQTTTMRLDASNSSDTCVDCDDPTTDAIIETWRWAFKDPTGAKSDQVCIGSVPIIDCTVTPGVYNVQLTVTDNGAATDQTLLTGVEAAANTLPVPVIDSVDTIVEDWNGDGWATVEVDGTGSHDLRRDGGDESEVFVTQWDWTFINADGEEVECATSTTPVAQCEQEPGLYTVHLETTDNGGGKNETTLGDVEVLANTPPIAEITRLRVEDDWDTDGQVSIELDGSGSLDQRLDGGPLHEVGIAAWAWTVSKNGATVGTCTGEDADCSVPRLPEGQGYDVTLEVTDNGGATDRVGVTNVRTYGNQHPSAQITGFTVEGTSRTVVLHGRGEDPRLTLECRSITGGCQPPRLLNPPNPVLDMIWGLGDGTTLTETTDSRTSEPTHTYGEDGLYRVRLNSRDAGGLESPQASQLLLLDTLYEDSTFDAFNDTSMSGLWHIRTKDCTDSIEADPTMSVEGPFLAYTRTAVHAAGTPVGADAQSPAAATPCSHATITGASEGSATFQVPVRGWPTLTLGLTHRGGFDPDASQGDAASVEWRRQSEGQWRPVPEAHWSPDAPLPQEWTTKTYEIPVHKAFGPTTPIDGLVEVRFLFHADGTDDDGIGWLIDQVSVSGGHGKALIGIDPLQPVDHLDDGEVLVTLDGSRAVFVPDHIIDQYTWFTEGGAVIGTDRTVEIGFEPGQHTVILQVKVILQDGSTALSENRLTFEVLPNVPPVPRIDVRCGGPDCILDGTGSHDPLGGAIVSHEWAMVEGVLPGLPVGSSPGAPGQFPVSGVLPGRYVVELSVTDGAGATNTTMAAFIAHPAGYDLDDASTFEAQWTKQALEEDPDAVNLWHRKTLPACERVEAPVGTRVLAFTVPASCSYRLDQRTGGTIETTIDLDSLSLGDPELRFATTWELSPCEAPCLEPVAVMGEMVHEGEALERLEVQVRPTGGDWETVWTPPVARVADWHLVRIGLDDWAQDDSLELRFLFDSVGTQAEPGHYGWFIDRIRIDEADERALPVADPGLSDTTVTAVSSTGAPVNLDGTLSTVQGEQVSYLWLQDDTPLLSGPSGTVLMGIGHHTITLQVSDETGQQEETTLPVIVSAPSPTEVDACPPEPQDPDDPCLYHAFQVPDEQFGQVRLDGSQSQPAERITSYEWELEQQPAGTGSYIPLGEGVRPFVQIPALRDSENEPLVQNLLLRVTDVDGISSEMIAQVQVNRPPTADAGEDLHVVTGAMQETVVIDSSGTSEGDQPIAGYLVLHERLGELTSSPTFPADGKISLTLPVGVNDLRLVVTDDKGGSGEDKVRIEVVNPDVLLPVTSSTDLLVEDMDRDGTAIVALNATGSTVAAGPATYEWYLEDADLPGRFASIGEGIVHEQIFAVGEHEFRLVVTDDEGRWMEAFLTINVNTVPVADAGDTPDIIHNVDGAPSATVPLHFSASEDPDGSIDQIRWEHDNGTVLLDWEPASLHPEGYIDIELPNGPHRVKLSVRDEHGSVDHDEVTFMVNQVPQPRLSIEPAHELHDHDGDGTETFFLHADTSTDPDDGIQEYRWYRNNQLIGQDPVFTWHASLGGHAIQLEVEDHVGGIKRTTPAVPVTVWENQAPDADAGEDLVHWDHNSTGSVWVTLNATASMDPDEAHGGSILWYNWSVLHRGLPGSSTPDIEVPIASSDEPMSVVSLPVNLGASDHVVFLRVTDNGGATAMDTLNITALPNREPVADAGGPLQVTDFSKQGVAVELDATKSFDPDEPLGSIVNWTWIVHTSSEQVPHPDWDTFLDDPSGSLPAPGDHVQVAHGEQAEVVLERGNHSLHLVIMDNGHALSVNTTWIQVDFPENRLPVADAGEDQVHWDHNSTGEVHVTLDAGESFDPDVTALDPDDDEGHHEPVGHDGIVRFEWFLLNEPTPADALPDLQVPLVNTTQPKTNITLPLLGTEQANHTLVLRVTDQWDDTALDIVNVTVLPNRTPTADAGGPRQAIDFTKKGVAVELDATKSFDPDEPLGSIVNWTWLVHSSSEDALSPDWEAFLEDPSGSLPAPGDHMLLVHGEHAEVVLERGNHTLHLVITDDGHARASNSTWIKVVFPENRLPVADAGEDQVHWDHNSTGDVQVTLDGSESFDPDVVDLDGGGGDEGHHEAVGHDGIVRFEWFLLNEPLPTDSTPDLQVPLVNTTQPKTNITLPLLGTDQTNHTIVLRVSDQWDDTSLDTVNITVLPNRSPVARSEDPGVQHVRSGETALIQLNGTRSHDPDEPLGSIVNWTWIVHRTVDERLVPDPEDLMEDPAGSLQALDPQAQTLEGEVAEAVLEPGNHTVHLIVKDDGHFFAVNTTRVHVNIIPIADTNGTQELVHLPSGADAGPVGLDATASHDPDDGTLTYEWFLNGMMDEPVFKAPEGDLEMQAGTNTLTLRVTDDHGATNETDVTVHLNRVPAPSTDGTQTFLHVASDATTAQVELDATQSTDPDGDELTTYEWFHNGSLLATGEESTGTLPINATGEPTVLTVTLRVTDEHGGSHETDVGILINRAPVPTTAGTQVFQNVSADATTAEVTLSGASSFDPDGDDLAAYEWFLGDEEIAAGASPTVDLPLNNTGEATVHTVTLRVTDEHGGTADTDVNVHINRVPAAATTGTQVFQNVPSDATAASVSLDGTTSMDPDGDDLVSYEWSLDGQEIATGTSTTVTLPLAGPGVATVHAVKLRVTDEHGGSAETDVEVHINRVPAAATTGTQVFQNVSSDATSASVSLDGSMSMDPDGDELVSYDWLLGDEEIATGASPTVVLPLNDTGEATLHTVTLQVTDEHGGSAETDVSIHINRVPVPDTAGTQVFQNVPSDTLTATVELNGTMSLDPDMDALVSYEWFSDDDAIATGAVSTAELPLGPIGGSTLHTLTLRVADAHGGEDETDVEVHINRLPVPSTQGTETFIRAPAEHGGGHVVLDAQESQDPDDDGLVVYEWLLGDNVIATGAETAAFLGHGVHMVTLRVTDEHGGASETQVEIEVDWPFATDFSGGALDDQGWSVLEEDANLWRLLGSSECTTSGTGTPMLAFNEADCDYDSGGRVIGDVVSPAFSLAFEGASSMNLSLLQHRDVESSSRDVDMMQVHVTTDGGLTWDLVEQWDARDGDSDGWETAEIDLSAYIGEEDVQIRFHFDSKNRFSNVDIGWVIDEIVIR